METVDVIRAMAKLAMLLFMAIFILMMSEMGCLGLNFDFPNFKSTQTYPDLLTMNHTYFATDFISLLDYNAGNAGRVLYKYPIPLWSTNSTTRLTSFSTSFHFRIQQTATSYNSYIGEGMAFLLSGSLSPAPTNSLSDRLGLMDPLRDGWPSNNFVAVELDFFQDSKFADPGPNHVGIDINSLHSSSTRSLNDVNIYPWMGTNLMAWIDYDGDSKILSVFISPLGPKPIGSPFLSFPIDLSFYLPQDIYVGFSAGSSLYSLVYEIHSWQFRSNPLLAPAPAPATIPAPPIIPSPNKFPDGAIVGIVFASIFLLVLLPIIFCLIKRHRNKEDASETRRQRKLNAKLSECAGPRRFSYKEIMRATRNLSEENRLGCGGFGPVYKGILPMAGTLIAVKSIGQNSIQGEKEFLAEVTIISQIRHRNLLQLQGWCHEKGHMFLVYDYMPNGSLDQHLFKGRGRNNIENPPLDWNRRYAIVCGLAAALQYLHQEWEKQVIHRDVKSANVLLDHDFSPRLGDFGMARLIDHQKMQHTTIGAGTLGYLAPEVLTGKATSASDVYGFGAVALEVACGRSALDQNAPFPNQVHLVEWVWELHSNALLLDAADPKLEGRFDKEEMAKVLELGLACSHSIPQSRPTMSQVLDCLLKNSPIPQISTSKPLVVYSDPPFQNTTQPSNSQETCSTSATAPPHSSLFFGPLPR